MHLQEVGGSREAHTAVGLTWSTAAMAPGRSRCGSCCAAAAACLRLRLLLGPLSAGAALAAGSARAGLRLSTCRCLPACGFCCTAGSAQASASSSSLPLSASAAGCRCSCCAPVPIQNAPACLRSRRARTPSAAAGRCCTALPALPPSSGDSAKSGSAAPPSESLPSSQLLSLRVPEGRGAARFAGLGAATCCLSAAGATTWAAFLPDFFFLPSATAAGCSCCCCCTAAVPAACLPDLAAGLAALPAPPSACRCLLRFWPAAAAAASTAAAAAAERWRMTLPGVPARSCAREPTSSIVCVTCAWREARKPSRAARWRGGRNASEGRRRRQCHALLTSRAGVSVSRAVLSCWMSESRAARLRCRRSTSRCTCCTLACWTCRGGGRACAQGRRWPAPLCGAAAAGAACQRSPRGVPHLGGSLRLHAPRLLRQQLLLRRRQLRLQLAVHHAAGVRRHFLQVLAEVLHLRLEPLLFRQHRLALPQRLLRQVGALLCCGAGHGREGRGRRERQGRAVWRAGGACQPVLPTACIPATPTCAVAAVWSASAARSCAAASCSCRRAVAARASPSATCASSLLSTMAACCSAISASRSATTSRRRSRSACRPAITPACSRMRAPSAATWPPSAAAWPRTPRLAATSSSYCRRSSAVKRR